MEWPVVNILIVTYDRPQEIRKTIDALQKHLKYDGKLLWHLADDSSPGDYIHDIQRDYQHLHFTATVTERKGWGANVNKAMVFCWERSDYVFLIEDDYVAQKNIDLSSGVAILAYNEKAGLVRYDGVEGHTLDLALRETKTPLGQIQTLVIAMSSPHLNLYSNRPHLKHRRFHDKYGLYAEGKRLGETESGFAHRVRNKYPKSPKIVVLKDGIVKAFDHIGKSRQLGEKDVGK